MSRPADGGGGDDVFTPPPGSPGAIRDAAASLSRSAEPVQALSTSLRHAEGEVSGSWGDSGGASFEGFAGHLDGLGGQAAAPITSVAATCQTYADALDTAQKAIKDAKSRYDAATARAAQIQTSTNADASRTHEQVVAAQQQVDAANHDAQQARDDATKAWSTYDTAVTTAIGHLQQEGSESDVGGDEGWLGKFLEHTEPYRDYNDKFHTVWDGLGLGSWLSHLSKAVRAGLPEAEDALESLKAERGAWDALVKSVQALQEQGEVLPSILDDAAQAASDLERTEGLLGSLENGAKAASVFEGLEGLGKFIDGGGVLADALTIIDPPDKGVMGNVDRGVAGVNGALLVANMTMDEIPVAGEVVMVGTGVYLAGDYLYHHWGAFHDACDWVGHGAADLAQGAWNGAKDVASDVSHVASDAWDGAKSLASGIGSLF